MRGDVRRIELAAVQAAVRAAEPAALFIEPRILRRVIKQDRRLAGIGLHVPHGHVYVIERERLLVIVERSELDLSPAAELPPWVILLPRPEEDDPLLGRSPEQALLWYWRQLFHARVHIEIEGRLAENRLDQADIRERVRELGATEFAEVRQVLTRDDLIPPTHTEAAAWVEFAAVACELRYFAAADRALYFPALRDWGRVDELLGRDVRHEVLYRETRPEGVPDEIALPRGTVEDDGEFDVVEPPPPDATPSPARCTRLQNQAQRAARVGNQVKAAVLRMRAAEHARPEQQAGVRAEAEDELRGLARRLQAAFGFAEERVEEWTAALGPLLGPACSGFRRVEARFLYDLQKVCIAHERGFFRFAWGEWLRSGRKGPLRRPLPVLQQVIIAKQLRSASRRVATIGLAAEERERIEELLSGLVDRAEVDLRQQARPLMTSVLDEVGLVPANVPERVARRKLVEELLDRVVEHGFITMGDLRDALSQNDLKLPDVSGLLELVRGDKLLRADRRLGSALDGAYRAGAIYLRWPQRLSSLAFGTPLGRFLTQYLVLPFGGAYLALEGLKHLGLWVVDLATPDPVASDASAASRVVPSAANSWEFNVSFLLLGTLLLFVMHRPRFRAWLVRTIASTGSFVRRIVFELPADLFRAAWVQRILQSQTYAVLRNYVFRPSIFTGLCAGLFHLSGRTWDRDFTIQFFLGANLLLNTPLGRFANEWLADVLVRSWHELRIRVLAAALQWVMDLFHFLLEWLERIIYTVDEWLRFRAGDARALTVVKLVLNTAWYFVSYVVRFCVTLLIEPQVNPIKHFPVVTVSHKVLLPLTPEFALRLIPFFGSRTAYTIATATVLVLPGVFGFLVWELKENWRLYVANRARKLVPIAIGRHGETLARLLRPGIHSGTLPKLYAKLRRALRQGPTAKRARTVSRYLAQLNSVEVSVRRCVDRTFCAFLAEDGFCRGVPPAVGAVWLATNRIDVELRHPLAPRESLWLRFDDRAGWLTAQIHRRGWLDLLEAADRERFDAALAGLYKLAGVDLVCEQWEQQLGPVVDQAVLTHDELVLAANGTGDGSVSYRLRSSSAQLVPHARNGRPVPDWPVLDRDDVLYDESPIDWDDWVAVWANGAVEPADGARFPTVLPAAARSNGADLPEAPVSGTPDPLVPVAGA